MIAGPSGSTESWDIRLTRQTDKELGTRYAVTGKDGSTIRTHWYSDPEEAWRALSYII